MYFTSCICHQVWDSARSIRCVFDGKGGDVSQKVMAALSVAKIDQQVVSFSADTQATATLDIQVTSWGKRFLKR